MSLPRLTLFLLVSSLALPGCACGPAVPVQTPDAGDAPDAGPSEDAGDACAGLAPLTLVASRTRVHVLESLTLQAGGGSGQLAFAVLAEDGGAGGALSDATFTAGSVPGTVGLQVRDLRCGEEARVLVEVVEPFDAFPHEATVRPGTSFTLEVVGALGAPAYTLVSSEAGSHLEEDGRYTAGEQDGEDVLRVRDTGAEETRELRVSVRAGARLEAVPARVALPAGASVPLRTRGGSDRVRWSVRSGPGRVEGGRLVLAPEARGVVVLDGVDPFTGDVVEVTAHALEEVGAAVQSGEAHGSSVALGRGREGQPLLLVGAPGWMDGETPAGRAYVAAVDAGVAQVVAEGAASPLLRGQRVGEDVAFTDFNGDGRQDLVVGMPQLQVPGSGQRDTELTPFYAVERPGCIAAQPMRTGGIGISLGRADGGFQPAYRLWGTRQVAGCTPDTDARCQRRQVGREVAGGFDVNGDGVGDVAALREGGLELFLGRAPDDATLAKLTMGCDPAFTAATVPWPLRALTALHDLDGDGCDEVAWGYDADAHSGLVVLFGFDSGGTRCGGRASPAWVRIDTGTQETEAFRGMGLSIAQVGRFLSGQSALLAVGATLAPRPDGGQGPAVVLLPVSGVVARRPASGEAVAELSQLEVHVLPGGKAAQGFGAALAGGGDVTGDGVADLWVAAPADAFAGPGTGAVYLFAGGADAGPQEPYLVVAGDSREQGRLGSDVALLPAATGRGPILAVGAPSSGRSVPDGGTVFLLPGSF